MATIPSGATTQTITKRRIGPTQSPVVSATLSKRNSEVKATLALRKAVLTGILAFLLFIDWYFSLSHRNLFGVALLVFQYAELIVACVFLLSTLYDVTIYISTPLSLGSIKLTAKQMQMLKVKKATAGYEHVDSPLPFGPCVSSTPLVPHSHTPPLHCMSPSISFHSSVRSTPQSSSVFGSRMSTPSSFCGHPFITPSPHHIDRFSEFRTSPDISPSVLPDTGRYASQAQPSECSPSLRKYHVASRSHSPAADRLVYSMLGKDTESGLAKIGVTKTDLDIWTERCRKWLAQTVVSPLAKEIENVNQTLCKLGSPELKIGSVSLGTLRLVSKTMAQQVPTLSMVIPYLELSTKQGYLVDRIKELSKGSNNLGAFRWNSGGSWKGRIWEQDLPNDSQIVMHLLCTYLDSQMPPNPQFPDGKAFSSQYFNKFPSKPDLKKTTVFIHQTCVNPPHYKVVSKGEVLDAPQGRNNLFYSIVIFLHCVKHKEKSLLGQVNLETSGINILWIIA